MLSVSFLLFGYAAQRKIWRSYSPSDVQNSWQNDKKFWKGLVRLNIIIIICVVCFVDKAILLILLSNDSSNDMDTPINVSVITWNLIYEWIPDIVPRFSLLYLMSRNVEEVRVDDIEGGRVVGRETNRMSSAENDDDDTSKYKVGLFRN